MYSDRGDGFGGIWKKVIGLHKKRRVFQFPWNLVEASMDYSEGYIINMKSNVDETTVSVVI